MHDMRGRMVRGEMGKLGNLGCNRGPRLVVTWSM